MPTFQNSSTGADNKEETESAEDIPTSVLVLHSQTDLNTEVDNQWHDLIKDNPFAQSSDLDYQMTSEKVTNRVVSLGPNSYDEFINTTPQVISCNTSSIANSEQFSANQSGY